MYISTTKLSYPISLPTDELFIKRSLAIYTDETDDNSFVNSLLESATDFTEGQINQDIAYSNNVVNLYDFSGDELLIRKGNFNSITSIVNNDTSTLISDFETIKSYDNMVIEFDESITSDSLTITFTTGWDNIDDIPKGLKLAIVCKTKALYDNDEKMNDTWIRYCQQYKLL